MSSVQAEAARQSLGELCEINPPKPNLRSLPDDTPVLFVPMAAVDDVTGTIADPQPRMLGEVRNKSYRTFAPGDVLFAKITPCMENGKSAIVPPIVSGIGFGSTEFHVLRPKNGTDPRLIWHFVRQEALRREARENMTGSVGQARVPAHFLDSVRFQLPEDNIQTELADLLDAVISNTHSVNAHLTRAHMTLERFRQAVLAAACSGRLTEDWRTNNPVQKVDARNHSIGASRSANHGRLWGGGAVPELTEEERGSLPDTWEWIKVDDVGTPGNNAVQIGPMSMKSSEFTRSGVGVPVLNVGSVQDGWIDSSKRNFLPPDRAAAFGRYRLELGDVLFTRSGTVGRCAVVSTEHAGSLITFHLLRVRPDASICLPQYLWCAFNGSPTIRRQRDEGQIGSTRAGFNTSLLAGLDVPLPPLPEQVEIVQRVRKFLDLADILRSHIDAATKRVDLSSQAVLAKAFRGELFDGTEISIENTSLVAEETKE